MRLPAISIVFFLITALSGADTPEIAIPRIDHKLGLADFDGMQPRQGIAEKLKVIDQFVQTNPKDGAAPSQRTVVYIAYDSENLYVIFVCFDTRRNTIAASISRREGFTDNEDWIEMYLDTFNDQRRAYCLSTNALGVQWDSRYQETAGNPGQGGHQPSFDALWYSDGKLTDEGYIVSMTVPFKSIRFPSADPMTWRILFGRSIPRTNEYVAWPHMSRSIQGFLTQSSLLTGLSRIQPGKNFQLIPFASYRAFRLLDPRLNPPRFVSDNSDAAAGADVKYVLKDSYVFDLALNPDFSQVESDQPQVTVNQRFEVFYREKRPFFLENAQFFETPLNLVFTRRIADPQFGGRATGKAGPFTYGALYTNDEAPGKLAPFDSPLSGKDARFAIARLSADVFSQSSVGVLFTDRTFAGSDNRVFGGDFRFRLGDHWRAGGQAVMSQTSFLNGVSLDGSGYDAELKRTGEHLGLNVLYQDLSPDFITLTGYIPRVDYRKVDSSIQYYFRPNSPLLLAWGPELSALESWDYEWTRLDTYVAPALYFELPRKTTARFKVFHFQQRLRPVDFPVLEQNTDFNTPGWGLEFQTSYWHRGTLRLTYEGSKDINFVPPEGKPPTLGDRSFVEAELDIRPLQQLQIHGSYLFSGLSQDAGTIFNDHIISIRTNYQFTREISLRLIVQYESTITNPALTGLEDRRNLNADVLFTYQVNPWTALYVGYNGNGQNYRLDLIGGIPSLTRRNGSLLNDANQFFMKFSYLFRM